MYEIYLQLSLYIGRKSNTMDLRGDAMARYTRRWNESVYKRYIREGRGRGCGSDYRPWLTVRDFPSLGMASRIKGQTTGRVYHMMSNLETNLFYLLDWSDEVLDIREQYPLSDLCGAIEIAEKAQIRYPYDARSGFPYVMTSDFYVDTINGSVVLSVKPSSELEKLRVREKLEIERRYWNARNVKWELVTEREINFVKSRNIEWLAQASDLTQFDLSSELQEMCKDYFLSSYTSSSDITNALFEDLEARYGLPAGIGFNIYKHLAFHKIVDINVDQPINRTLFGSQSVKITA